MFGANFGIGGAIAPPWLRACLNVHVTRTFCSLLINVNRLIAAFKSILVFCSKNNHFVTFIYLKLVAESVCGEDKLGSNIALQLL